MYVVIALCDRRRRVVGVRVLLCYIYLGVFFFVVVNIARTSRVVREFSRLDSWLEVIFKRTVARR